MVNILYNQFREEIQMDLFLVFVVAAVAGGLWINYILNKKRKEEELVQQSEAPYKVEPTPPPVVEPVSPPVITTVVEPVVQSTETVKETKVKKPRAKPVAGAKTKTSVKTKTAATKAVKKTVKAKAI